MQLVRRGLRHRCARAHPIAIMAQTRLMHYSKGPDPKSLIFSAKWLGSNFVFMLIRNIFESTLKNVIIVFTRSIFEVAATLISKNLSLTITTCRMISYGAA